VRGGGLSSHFLLDCMTSRGRKRDTFTYDQFGNDRVIAGNSTKKRACKHCQQNIVSAVDRMRSHLACCEPFRKNYSATDKECRLYTTFMTEQGNCTEESIVQRFGDRYRFTPRHSPASMIGDSTVANSIASDKSMDPPAAKRPRQSSLISSAASASSSVSSSSILQYLDRTMTAAEKFKIDEAIARYIHLRGASFSPFHNEEGMEVLKLLRKSYMDAGGPPSMEQVSTTFLNSHSLEVMGLVTSIIVKNFAVGLTSDGWTDRQSNGLHNCMVATPIPFVLGATRKSAGERDDAVTLSNMALDMTKKIHEMFETRDKSLPVLYGFCTDSPNGNKGMRNRLANLLEAKQLRIFPYGCVCHALNNFGKDVCKLGIIPKVLAQVKVVCQVFRNVSHAKYALQKEQKQRYSKTLQLLMWVDTRWNSNVAMLLSVMRSKQAIRDVVEKSRYDELQFDLKKETGGKNSVGLDGSQLSCYDILVDPGFWPRLEQAIALLQPIARLVTELEGDLVPLSMLPAAFIKLWRSYKLLESWSGGEPSQFQFHELGLSPSDFTDAGCGSSTDNLPGLLRRRWNEITAHTVNPSQASEFSSLLHLAFFIDPCTRGLATQAMLEFIQFDKDQTIRHGIVAGASLLFDMLKDDCRFERFDPKKTGESVAIHFKSMILGEQCKKEEERMSSFKQSARLEHPISFFDCSTMEGLFAQVLFRLPASAAGGERSFNVYSDVHSKKRNRMGGEKLDKMVQIRMNSKQIKRAHLVDIHVRSESLLAFIYSNSFETSSSLIEDVESEQVNQEFDEQEEQEVEQEEQEIEQEEHNFEEASD